MPQIRAVKDPGVFENKQAGSSLVYISVTTDTSHPISECATLVSFERVYKGWPYECLKIKRAKTVNQL